MKSLPIVIAAFFVIGPISHSIYAQAERPKAYALLIDNTRSLDKRFDQVKLALPSVFCYICGTSAVFLRLKPSMPSEEIFIWLPTDRLFSNPEKESSESFHRAGYIFFCAS